jgi:hypothetical protein
MTVRGVRGIRCGELGRVECLLFWSGSGSWRWYWRDHPWLVVSLRGYRYLGSVHEAYLVTRQDDFIWEGHRAASGRAWRLGGILGAADSGQQQHGPAASAQSVAGPRPSRSRSPTTYY